MTQKLVINVDKQVVNVQFSSKKLSRQCSNELVSALSRFSSSTDHLAQDVILHRLKELFWPCNEMYSWQLVKSIMMAE